MKRRATGLLVGSAGVFAAAQAFQARWPWLGWVRAAAEAATVGGVADWFAVTALFRRPLGLPIPHTAIIPTRKDRLGRTLGAFVHSNFLSREAVLARFDELRVGARLAEWLTVPDNRTLVARQLAAAVSGPLELLRDDDVRRLVERGLAARLRSLKVGSFGVALAALAVEGGRHRRLGDDALASLARCVVRNGDALREKALGWFPAARDARFAGEWLDHILSAVRQAAEDPSHPLRQGTLLEFERRVALWRDDPGAGERLDALKTALLENAAVREFAASMWGDGEERVVRFAAGKGAWAQAWVERGLGVLACAVLSDGALRTRLEAWVRDGLLEAAERYRGEVEQLIAHTMSRWDAGSTSRKIELQVGRDLQFIRINGTLVGGLTGLVLHALASLF